MICIICHKEITGAYLQVKDRPGLCRHITCGQKSIVVASEIFVKPKDVITYRSDLDIKDPDFIINENIIGDINDKD